MFPTTPGLDQDLGSVGMLLNSPNRETEETTELSDYYDNLQQPTQGNLLLYIVKTIHLLINCGFM